MKTILIMVPKPTTCHKNLFLYPYHFLMVRKKSDSKSPNRPSLSLEEKNEKKKNLFSIMILKTTTF
jgi:hypothetical protein